MNKPIEIAGPAVAHYDGEWYESREGISVLVETSTEEVKTSVNGKIAERITGRKAEIKVTPLRWSAYQKLFGLISIKRGDTIFGAVMKPLKVYSSDGFCYEFVNAAITAIPSIGVGITQERLGEFTWTALPAWDKPFTAEGSLMIKTVAAWPEYPELLDSDLTRCGYVAQWGDPANGGFVFDLAEGATIDFEVSTSECKLDRLGLHDFRVTDVNFTLKTRPSTTMENYLELCGVSNSPRLGSLLGGGKDLRLFPEIAGEPFFGFSKVVVPKMEMDFDSENPRFKELEFKAMGNRGLGKFTIGTAAGAWDYALFDEHGKLKAG